MGVGASVCALLRASAALTVTPSGIELSGWGRAPVTADFTSIHWVRRGRSTTLIAGARTVPIVILRLGTARNEAAVVAVISESGAGWLPARRTVPAA
jgi:hypothetical protein